jgi:P2-related tail formation protein
MTDPPREQPVWPPSSLLQYLPAIYRQDAFLGRFLLAFEKLLFGRDDRVQLKGNRSAALEDTIAGMPAYFIPLAIEDDPLIPDTTDGVPRDAPADFVPWLASWTAFSLRFDLDERQQREFIANIIPLYRERGTKSNLVRLLKIFAPLAEPEIREADDRPHFFRATVYLKRHEPRVLLRQIAIANALVELERPAHTEFELRPEFPGMRIGVHSRVGVDTLLGTILVSGMQIGVQSTVGVDTFVATVWSEDEHEQDQAP